MFQSAINRVSEFNAGLFRVRGNFVSWFQSAINRVSEFNSPLSNQCFSGINPSFNPLSIASLNSFVAHAGVKGRERWFQSANNRVSEFYHVMNLS